MHSDKACSLIKLLKKRADLSYQQPRTWTFALRAPHTVPKAYPVSGNILWADTGYLLKALAALPHGSDLGFQLLGREVSLPTWRHVDSALQCGFVLCSRYFHTAKTGKVIRAKLGIQHHETG